NEALPANKAQVVCLDESSDLLAAESTDNPVSEITADNLVYVIFTSGSTGIPKGAGVYHRGFVNLLNWFVKELDISSRDRVLLSSSFGFDLTQKNIYAPLIVGGKLYLLASDYYDPEVVLDSIFADRITLLNCTPSAFYPLLGYSTDGSTA